MKRYILFLVFIISNTFVFCQNIENQKLLSQIYEQKYTLKNEEIKIIINKLTDINEKLANHENLLFIISNMKATDSTSLNSKLDLMEYILQKGANPNTLNQVAQIPPLYVIEEEEGFDLLIKYGADVNFNSEYVHIFNKITTYERVKKVMSLGLDTAYNVGYENLYINIFLNHMDVETLDFLLTNYKDKATQYDNLGWNFTHYVSSGKRVDLLETLIKHEINLTYKTKLENGGNYGYDNGIKKGSAVIDIINQLKSDYISKIGEEKTNELIEKIKVANTKIKEH